jgi:hypothetical protein
LNPPQAGQEAVELILIYLRQPILAAGWLVMTGCWIFHPEEVMQKSPNVRLAMTRLAVAYIENHDAKPIIVVRSERWLSRERKPVAALEPDAADNRFERAAQTVGAELLTTRIDSQ